MPERYWETMAIESVSITSPGCRMVILYATWSDDEDDRELFVVPVLAIQALVVRDEDGDRQIGYDYLVFDSWHYGELLPASECLTAGGSCYKVVVCTWPPEEDEERLASRKIEVMAESKRKADRLAIEGKSA